MLLESIAIALGQLWANRVRAALTLLGMLIGVGSVVGIVSISEGMRRTVIPELAKFRGANVIEVSPQSWIRKGGRYVQNPHYKPMTMADLDYLAQTSDRLTAVLPRLRAGMGMRYHKATYDGQIEATAPSYPEVNSWEVEEGRFLMQKDLDARRRVCVLGKRAQEELFGESSPLGREIKISTGRYLVVGVMKERRIFGNELGYQAFVPVTTAQQRLFGSKRIQGATLFTKDPGDADTVIPAVRKALRRRYGPNSIFQIQSGKGFLESVESSIMVMKMVTGGIAGISLLVGGIGIMNIMLVSVTERTREIGIRKALGAKPGTLMLQFVVEAVVLSLTGGIMGIGLGVGLGEGISAFIEHFADSPFPSVVSSGSVILSLGISATIGLFFGIYPAARAARLDPVDALGYE